MTGKQEIELTEAEENLEDSIQYIDELSKLRVYYDDKEVDDSLDFADKRRADRDWETRNLLSSSLY